MSKPDNFIDTLKVANEILNNIICEAYKKIKINRFAERNQLAFIQKNQQNIFNSNLKHILEKPLSSITYLQRQPKNIPEDNFMNGGGCGKSNSILQNKQRFSLKLSSGRCTIKSFLKQETQPKLVRHKIKQVFLSKLQVLFKQTQFKEEQHEFYVQHLRNLKIQQQKANISKKPKAKLKSICILGKNEQIVYDYEGNFSKRKQSPQKQFENNNLEGNPIKPLNLIQSRQKQSNEKATNIEILQRNRGLNQYSKLRTTHQQEYKQKLFQSNSKAESIDQIQIKHQGIKLVVDGNPIKKQDNLESKFEDFKINPSTFLLKKVKESHKERFKTQNVTDIEMQIKRKKKDIYSKKSRMVTQFNQSSLPPKSDKISIQNQSLHSFILHNQEENENRYIQLPNKQSFQRRMKTNVQKSSRIASQFYKLRQRSTSLIKQKDRSINLMNQGNRLPKILSVQHHYQIEAEVFKQFRDKCKKL